MPVGDAVNMKVWTGSSWMPTRLLNRAASSWVDSPLRIPEIDVGGEPLTWAPPSLTNPETITVSGDLGTRNGNTMSDAGLAANTTNTNNVFNLTAGQDYIINFAGAVNRRLALRGGRHIRIIGGEIDIDTDWSAGVGDEKNGLLLRNQTGTVHVEGVKIGGQFCNDGIKIDTTGSSVVNIIQIENCRIGPIYGTNAGYHCDGVQPVTGFNTAIRFDKVTVSSQFQAQMMRCGTGPLLEWRNTTMKRYNAKYNVNFDGSGSAEGILLNIVSPGGETIGPVTFSDVYLEPHPTRPANTLLYCLGEQHSYWSISGDGNTASWVNGSLTVTGDVKKGPPPDGDYCPADVPGLDYVSPGYL